VPNVTPKQIWAKHDDTCLVVADIASPNSVENIKQNPAVCLSFIDIFRQRGSKITGKAVIFPKEDPQFEIFGAALVKMAGPKFDVRNVIKIDVERISRILAPSYQKSKFPNEDAIRDDAYQTYGVRPL